MSERRSHQGEASTALLRSPFKPFQHPRVTRSSPAVPKTSADAFSRVSYVIEPNTPLPLSCAAVWVSVHTMRSGCATGGWEGVGGHAKAILALNPFLVHAPWGRSSCQRLAESRSEALQLIGRYWGWVRLGCTACKLRLVLFSELLRFLQMLAKFCGILQIVVDVSG